MSQISMYKIRPEWLRAGEVACSRVEQAKPGDRIIMMDKLSIAPVFRGAVFDIVAMEGGAVTRAKFVESRQLTDGQLRVEAHPTQWQYFRPNGNAAICPLYVGSAKARVLRKKD